MATPTRTCITVHPHACGEIHAFADTYAHYGGTSPRLWGDCRRCPKRRTSVRYIPTPVGRLFGHPTPVARWTVHPHACGEIFSARCTHPVISGTSPRLWGDSAQVAQYMRSGRYIPTPVGRFDIGNISSPVHAVHPHACGEIMSHISCQTQ